MFYYDPAESAYHPNGKSVLLNANKILVHNKVHKLLAIRRNINNTDDIEELDRYVPFLMDVDMDSRKTKRVIQC